MSIAIKAGFIFTSAILLLFGAFHILFYQYIKKGRFSVNIRDLPVLEYFDKVIKHCAEAKRPAMYSVGDGLYGLTDSEGGPLAVAALALLNYFAEECVKNDVRILMIIPLGEVLPLARENVHRAALRANKPEYYNENDIWFVPGPYAYSFAMYETMQTQKPGGNILMGCYAGFAGIGAVETGNFVGAINIASGARYINSAPFMVTCEYTLLGPEMFVAGTFVSKNPTALGAVQSMDILALASGLIIFVGLLLSVVGIKIPFY